MQQLFSIGEMSKLFQLKTSAIRYYCDIGLLIPTKIDTKTGYRYFSTTHFEQLNTIKYLQALGLALDDIRTFLAARNPHYLVAQLQQQQQITQQKIASLQQIAAKIATRIEQIEDALQTIPDEMAIQSLPARYCVMLKQQFAKDADLELSIRQLENASQLQATVFLGKIGMSIAYADLQQRHFEHYHEIFLLIEHDTVPHQQQKKIAAGLYATIRFRGTHAQAAPYYEKLLHFIEHSNYHLRGHSIEITYIDAGLSTDEQQYITEIQLPIAIDSQVT